jgi:hypothetical protein
MLLLLLLILLLLLLLLMLLLLLLLLLCLIGAEPSLVGFYIYRRAKAARQRPDCTCLREREKLNLNPIFGLSAY